MFFRQKPVGSDTGFRILPWLSAAVFGLGLCVVGPSVQAGSDTFLNSKPLTVLLRGDAPTELAPHGQGNVYAPEIVRDRGLWRMYYGGQGKDGHDRIHLAESRDGKAWVKRGVVLDRGEANHVNDPTLVRVGRVWWMFYTVAEKAEQDEIAAATSIDGLKWEKRGVVLGRGEPTSWDSLKVGRPSVLHEKGKFRMWFDGQPTARAAAGNPVADEVRIQGRAVGYAESRDGLEWKRHPLPVFRNGAGAVSVSRRPGEWVMLIESGTGVRFAVSRDGISWSDRGPLLLLSGDVDDRFGQVTPFLWTHLGRTEVVFGAAHRRTWDGNSIASTTVSIP